MKNISATTAVMVARRKVMLRSSNRGRYRSGIEPADKFRSRTKSPGHRSSSRGEEEVLRHAQISPGLALG
jgi:hypothetical protein